MSTNEELMAARDTMSLPSYNVKFKQLLPIHKAINVQPGDLRCSIACLETPRTSANVASLDANADTSDNVATCRSRSILFFSYWALIVSLIVALVASLIVIAFVVDHDAKRNVRNPRKGVPNSSLKATDRIDDAGRKEYYESLLLFLGETIMAPDSAQSNSLEWMAFDDIPIDAITSNRFWQRFALVVWYFEQGGTTLWSAVNSDPSAGWISFGEGVHECDWKGVDCDVHFQVTGLRLGIGMGITMTGTFLSTELGVLTHLNQLDLSGHRLQGSIPGQWQSLTNLGKYVDMLQDEICFHRPYRFSMGIQSRDTHRIQQ